LRFSAPLEDIEVKFVIEPQAGCAADNSCHDPNRWGAAPLSVKGARVSPARLKAMPISGAINRMKTLPLDPAITDRISFLLVVWIRHS